MSLNPEASSASSRCSTVSATEHSGDVAKDLPESRAGFRDLAVPLLLQHLRTLLSPVGWLLDDETLPGLFSLHGVAG